MDRSPGLLLGLALSLAGCGFGNGDTMAEATSPTNPGTESGDPTSATASATAATASGTDTDTGTSTTGPIEPQPSDAVDILFVIDDSGSMSDEQAILSQSISALLDPLANAGISYRVGITTTDAGNPRCPKADTTPPNGELVRSSCVDRVALGEFTFAGVDPPLDASFACTDYCASPDNSITITPTVTAVDDQAKARPWIEGGAGDSNVEGMSPAEALRCYLPQGVAGCGFESPLEAMHKALSRAATPGEASYGFLRDDASLLVLIVTDETDCSYADQSIFIDNKALWNDPDDPIPTSAVCWRAGVGCEGSSCAPEDRSANGGAAGSEADAALHPLSRYSGLLTEIAAAKSAGKVEVRVIAGVPSGYVDGAAIPFTFNDDPEFVDDFGVDPACASNLTGKAVPSMRERVLAEDFAGGERTTYSICDSDYGPALTAAAGSIIAFSEG
ncbi:MAG: VWA domain-containing protein [Myxococcales bacterium]|nr:VWA domain-containing protein [Myxococcales bacterium]